jgi:hypothetical protein
MQNHHLLPALGLQLLLHLLLLAAALLACWLACLLLLLTLLAEQGAGLTRQPGCCLRLCLLQCWMA